MRRVAVASLMGILFAAPVFAALSEVDTDGDNLATFAEMSVIYTDLTQEVFDQVDLNGDSFVDEAELTAALESELIKPAGE